MSNDTHIKFQYEEPAGAVPLLAGGLMTSPTPDGKVLLRFFAEFPTLQATETWRAENGQLVERIEQSGSDAQITRRIVSSLVMDPHTLTAVVAAINQQLANMRKPTDGGSPSPPPGFTRR